MLSLEISVMMLSAVSGVKASRTTILIRAYLCSLHHSRTVTNENTDITTEGHECPIVDYVPLVIKTSYILNFETNSDNIMGKYFQSFGPHF